MAGIENVECMRKTCGTKKLSVDEVAQRHMEVMQEEGLKIEEKAYKPDAGYSTKVEQTRLAKSHKKG